MHKHVVVAVLCGALCAFCLASCGGREPGPATQAQNVTAAAKEFVALMSAGEFARAVQSFDATMKQGMPPQKLKEAWNSLLSQAGAFKQQTGVRTAEEQGFDCVYVTCEFERDRVDVKVVFDRAGKISGLWFVPPR